MTTYGRTNAVTAGGGTPTPTQTKEVQATAFPTVVTPDSGYALSQATVTAPANLSAENIKAGVSIAGVEGSYEGGSDPVVAKFKALASAKAQNIDFTWSDIIAWVGAPAVGKTTWIIYDRTIKSVEINLNEATPNFMSAVTGAVNFYGQYNETAALCSRFTGDFSYNYDGVTYLGGLFNDSYLSDDVIIPEGITQMANTFYNVSKEVNGVTSSITITLPSTLTKISGNGTVVGHYSRPINIIMKATTPPTMASAGALVPTYSTDKYLGSITVPVGCLEAYRNATNWSALADYMVEATE